MIFRPRKKKKTTLSAVDDGSLGREKKKKKPCPSVGRGPETRRTGPRISGPRFRDLDARTDRMN
jgi:hypothetical protein